MTNESNPDCSLQNGWRHHPPEDGKIGYGYALSIGDVNVLLSLIARSLRVVADVIVLSSSSEVGNMNVSQRKYDISGGRGGGSIVSVDVNGTPMGWNESYTYSSGGTSHIYMTGVDGGGSGLIGSEGGGSGSGKGEWPSIPTSGPCECDGGRDAGVQIFMPENSSHESIFSSFRISCRHRTTGLSSRSSRVAVSVLADTLVAGVSSDHSSW